jgi:hypothetical protein
MVPKLYDLAKTWYASVARIEVACFSHPMTNCSKVKNDLFVYTCLIIAGKF